MLFYFQLYIKVSEDSSTTSSSDHASSSDPQLSGGSGSTAGELTDPHLPVLSRFWLAALKDKAYLFLPAEFGSQLPPSGGAFYSVNMMENVRPYYSSNWSSLLHAAAIWLQERGFREMKGNGGGKEERGAGLPAPLLSDGNGGAPSFLPPPTLDPRVANFTLVLGLAVQSLCTPATLDQPLVLGNCLRALLRLFSADTARDVLSSDARFSVEILSMLHRLLLTTQAPPTHVLTLRIAALVGSVMRKALQQRSEQQQQQQGGVANNNNNKGSDATPDEASKKSDSSSSQVPVSLETSVEPGSSCTYALLEVISCCLMRYVPSLQPPAGDNVPRPPTPSSGGGGGSAPRLPSSEELAVVLIAVRILATSCGLCTPEATPSVLPPALHLLLRTIGYVSTLASSKVSHTHEVPRPHDVSHLHNVALQSLSQLCAALPMSHDKAGPQLGQILQSALASVLGGYVGGARGESALVMSDESRMVVLAVLVHGASVWNICPSSSELFEGAVALFSKCLHSGDSKVW